MIGSVMGWVINFIVVFFACLCAVTVYHKALSDRVSSDQINSLVDQAESTVSSARDAASSATQKATDAVSGGGEDGK